MSYEKTAANLVLQVILPIAKKRGVSVEEVASPALVAAMAQDVLDNKDTFQSIRKNLG